jgi:hypothetical protein
MKTEKKEVAKFWTPKRVARMAIFIALSVVGALIKIPSPTGTVAMDSAPGFFVVLPWGFLEGMIVIALGHIATAASVGFPLGVLHLPIAILMAIAAVLFRLCVVKLPKKARISLIVGVIVAATFNGLMAILLSPILGLGLALAITPSLMVASYVNVIVAAVVYEIVAKAKVV